MHETTQVNLSEPISDQLNGIVLHWQGVRDNTAQPYEHVYQVIPKTHVDAYGEGVGMLMTSAAGVLGVKYVYVSDTAINGSATNIEETTQTNGVTFHNSLWGLDQVIGF